MLNDKKNTSLSWKESAIQATQSVIESQPGSSAMSKRGVLVELQKLDRELEKINFFAQFDSRAPVNIPEAFSFTFNSNFHEADLSCLHALPNGNILTGSSTGLVKIWSGGERVVTTAEREIEVNGQLVRKKLHIFGDPMLWDQQKLLTSNLPIIDIQAFSNRKVALATGNCVFVLKSMTNGLWDRQELEHQGIVTCFQVLPGERIVSGTQDGDVYFWEKNARGKWHGKVVALDGWPIVSLLVLPDWQIVAASQGNVFLSHALCASNKDFLFKLANGIDYGSLRQTEDGNLLCAASRALDELTINDSRKLARVRLSIETIGKEAGINAIQVLSGNRVLTADIKGLSLNYLSEKKGEFPLLDAEEAAMVQLKENGRCYVGFANGTVSLYNWFEQANYEK